MEPEDLMGQLEHGADALLRLDAGVGRSAFDIELEPADPLARGLELAAGEGGLQHQHVGAAPRLRLDRRARARAADLLVRGPERHDGSGQFEAPGPDRLDGEFEQHDRGLHVEDARPEGAAVFDPEGEFGERPVRPDGVEVPENQRRARVVGPPRSGPARPDVVAALGVGDQVHLRAEHLQPRRQGPGQRVECGPLPAG